MFLKWVLTLVVWELVTCRESQLNSQWLDPPTLVVCELGYMQRESTKLAMAAIRSGR